MDTGLAIVRRILRGHSVFDGDREHLHHRMLHAGLSHRRSVWLLYGLCAAFALTGLVTMAASNRLATAAGLLSLLAILALFERRVGFVRKSAAPGDAPASPNPVGLLHELRSELSRARTVDAVWLALVEAADELKFQRMRLLGSDRAAAALFEWNRPGLVGRPREGTYRMRVEVHCTDAVLVLEVEKRPLKRGWPVPDQLFAELFQEYLRDELRVGGTPSQSRAEAATARA